ncbi:MAG: glycosyltransferase family 4 protein [Bacteroidales bacterium]|jgi:glycosyltransferase involved in cell wall biosynthesis|nr:glycosyltransferase family 4 protein [Bacteroidales bacterium]
MKVLVVTQYFYPEEFKINDLVEELVQRGLCVTVLTGKPNYPKGSFFPGYHFWGVNKEVYKGANVIRVPLVRRGQGGAIRLMLNYLSYVLFGRIYVLFHKCDYDTVFVWGTSPITQAYPGILASRKSKSKLSLWIQDLWPESVSSASNIKNSYVLRMLNRMVVGIYKKCDFLFIQSESFRESIEKKGPFGEKLIYAPNWAEDVFVTNKFEGGKYIDLMPAGFKVMFAGNIGDAQDFNKIIDAAILTKNEDSIKWIIVGDGRFRNQAEERVQREGLSDKVVFLGRYSVNEMPSFFCHADVMLVSLKNEYIFSLTIPSKVQAYMAAGKPIVAMLNGEGSRVINDSGCGFSVPSSDAEKLAETVINMSKMSRDTLIHMGIKGRSYYLEHFKKSNVVDTIVRHI